MAAHDAWEPIEPDIVMREAFDRVDQRKFTPHFRSFVRGVEHPSDYVDAPMTIRSDVKRFAGGLTALFRYGWVYHPPKSAIVNREDVKRILRSWYVALYDMTPPGDLGGEPIDAAKRDKFLHILYSAIAKIGAPIHDMHHHIRNGMDFAHVTLKVMSASTQRIGGVFLHDPQKLAKHVLWLDTPMFNLPTTIENSGKLDLRVAYGLDTAQVVSNPPHTVGASYNPVSWRTGTDASATMVLMRAELKALASEVYRLTEIITEIYAMLRASANATARSPRPMGMPNANLPEKKRPRTSDRDGDDGP